MIKTSLRIYDKLENLNQYQRWVVVIGSAFPAMAASYIALQSAGDVLVGLFLFYIPMALSVLLLGFVGTAILTGVVVVTAFVNLLAVGEPLWVLGAFLAGIFLNFYLWFSWIKQTELQTFQFRKFYEEMELSINDSRLAHEKIELSYQANQIKIQRYTALNELARNLAMTFKTQDVVILLIETISKTFMVPGGVYTLLLFESSVGKEMHAVRYSVDTDMEVRLNRERLLAANPFNAWVILQKKPLVVNDAATDFRFQNIPDESKVRSLASAALMGGHELLGLIRMESSASGAFRQEDARLLSNFCDLGTVALEHVALYHQTIELATTDGLTGLHVQRYYKDRVRDEIFRALEHKLSLSVMMIDVDHFKRYNDTYGHLTGDKVLRLVAQILKESVRVVDLVSRYGGEEFSVLLVKTPMDGAFTVAERIREKVEEQEIEVGGAKTHVTVSIGVAELNPSFKDSESFIDFADHALYQAKSEGRNRVCLAKPGQGHE
ncbi:MAG TPA: diguanylate cyclase [bacterium]|nr:diguanylate cyclase [bacterium]